MVNCFTSLTKIASIEFLEISAFTVLVVGLLCSVCFMFILFFVDLYGWTCLFCWHVECARHFWWFGHMWSHAQPHQLEDDAIRKEMVKNQQFAEVNQKSSAVNLFSAAIM